MQTCCHLKIPQVSWSPFFVLFEFFTSEVACIPPEGRPIERQYSYNHKHPRISGCIRPGFSSRPEAIVNVALSLARMPNPSDYKLWLALYANRYQVSTTDLAVDVLIVLSYAADFVGSVISKASASQVKQLVAV